MMKRLLYLVFLLTLLAILIVPVSAEQYYYVYPDWFPDNLEDFRYFHGENLPLVVDNAEILSEAEEAELTEIAKRIVDVSGFGYVILTDMTSCGASLDLYAADFVDFNGYGTGDNYSATIFFLCLEPGNRGWRTIGVNDCADYFDAYTTYQIDELVDSDMRSGNYFSALKNQALFIEDYFENHSEQQSSDTKPYYDDDYYDYNDYYNHYYDDYYGYRSESRAYSILPFSVIGFGIGLIVAAISGKKMVNAMVLKTASSAASYLKRDSLNIKNTNVMYLYSNVMKTPRDTDSSSRGGRSSGSFGGGSMHSSGHSSGGSHFSGGGRNF